jgi:hypothetical protein
MTTTPTTTAKVTGVDISNGQVHLMTATGPVLAGTDHGNQAPGNAGPFTCNCGVDYTATDTMVQHVAYYCPRLHPEA